MTIDALPQVAEPGDWTCNTYNDKYGKYKVIQARGDGRNRVGLHTERLSAAEVEAFDPDAAWSRSMTRPKPNIVDLAAAVTA